MPIRWPFYWCASRLGNTSAVNEIVYFGQVKRQLPEDATKEHRKGVLAVIVDELRLSGSYNKGGSGKNHNYTSRMCNSKGIWYSNVETGAGTRVNMWIC